MNCWRSLENRLGDGGYTIKNDRSVADVVAVAAAAVVAAAGYVAGRQQ